MSNLFQPGNPGGPGRPKGSRNKLTEAFLDALHSDFQAHGAAAIEAARVESPLGYVRVVAGLLTQKVEVAHGSGSLTDDELLAIIRSGVEDTDAEDVEVVSIKSLRYHVAPATTALFRGVGSSGYHPEP